MNPPTLAECKRWREKIQQARSYSKGLTDKEVHELLDVVPRLVEAYEEIVKAAADVLQQVGRPAALDWACAECRPDSDMLQANFRCGFHALRAAIPEDTE